jgi:hypothetical protein
VIDRNTARISVTGRFRLVGISYVRAIIVGALGIGEPGVANAIPVRIRARVTPITRVIAIGVRLVGVSDIRAVVVIAPRIREPRVAKAIRVRVRTGIAHVTLAITVGVGLISVCRILAVVRCIAHAIGIQVSRTRVADTVPIAVGLVAVRCVGAIVVIALWVRKAGITEAVPIRVRAGVAGVTLVVVVEIVLIRVGDVWTVVARVTPTVVVEVILIAVEHVRTVVRYPWNDAAPRLWAT